MKFCSSCGGNIVGTVADDRERPVCSRCGAIHYENPRIIVGCAVCWRDKVLMVRRAQPPGVGQWAVPTGYLEFGESLEQAAARETREETGVVVAPEKLELCSVINMPTVKQVAIMFRIGLDAIPALAPGTECLEAAFLAVHEIPRGEFAWRSTMGDGPERFYRELVSGNFTIQLITLGAVDGSGFRSREYQIGTIHETVTDEP